MTTLTHPEIKVEYLSLASAKSGREISVIDEEDAIISGAIRIGTTRLIDNIFLKEISV